MVLASHFCLAPRLSVAAEGRYPNRPRRRRLTSPPVGPSFPTARVKPPSDLSEWNAGLCSLPPVSTIDRFAVANAETVI